MSRIDKEWLMLETLKVVRQVLTNGKTPMQQLNQKAKAKQSQRNIFRLPTKKELERHPKLMEKQRRRSMGE